MIGWTRVHWVVNAGSVRCETRQVPSAKCDLCELPQDGPGRGMHDQVVAEWHLQEPTVAGPSTPAWYPRFE